MQSSVATADALLPPLKWAGGKRWQVPVLRTYWQAHSRRRLVEPFCGGLAVALGLQPDRAQLNDANPHLINFYRCVKRGLSVSIEMRLDEALYYRQRERFNALVRSGNSQSRESAELFYYMNRTAYNGLCRFNSRGEFNSPFGQYKRINYAKDFLEYRDVFSKWDFSCGDFEETSLEKSDFLYADPPYDVDFTTYSKGGFSWNDQVRTAEWAARHKGPVILVNQATKRITDLYEKLKFNIVYIDAPRRISCNGDRTPAREVIARRNV